MWVAPVYFAHRSVVMHTDDGDDEQLSTVRLPMFEHLLCAGTYHASLNTREMINMPEQIVIWNLSYRSVIGEYVSEIEAFQVC